MKQPPIGSVVVDRRGGAWQRQPNGWYMSGSDGSWRYTWKELLKELYEEMRHPTIEWEPVLGDTRLPMIVYVPHEELLMGEEEE